MQNPKLSIFFVQTRRLATYFEGLNRPLTQSVVEL